MLWDLSYLLGKRSPHSSYYTGLGRTFISRVYVQIVATAPLGRVLWCVYNHFAVRLIKLSGVRLTTIVLAEYIVSPLMLESPFPSMSFGNFHVAAFNARYSHGIGCGLYLLHVPCT